MQTWRKCATPLLLGGVLLGGIAFPTTLPAQQVTYSPYIQPGDASGFGPKDQMVIAWQTDDTLPPSGEGYTVQYGTTPQFGHTVVPKSRVVDNYLAADPILSALFIPTAYGAHLNYYAVLPNLDYDTTYYYAVTGPGLPQGGFAASFHTRKQGSIFSFEVSGDQGFWPAIPNTDPAQLADFEARVARVMYHVQELVFPNQPSLPAPDFALNTGDNIYNAGSDSNYRDFLMREWNNTADTNDLGVPFIRHIPVYVVVGNHDIGGNGATANLLADDPPTLPGLSGPGLFGGGVSGGDALAHFNNYYLPLNGPEGVDIQSVYTGDNRTASGVAFKYKGTIYTAPDALEALRASTTVDTGQGQKRQIDHMSNFSFDYGNAHFVFLDANPHLFAGLIPNGTAGQAAPTFPFPDYPSVLRNWLLRDLDGSDQTWKIVVFHQAPFSSGNNTITNVQMRRVTKLLEDHGVNLVFNGHEHGYQRTRPLRALSRVTEPPMRPALPAVAIDTAFDGVMNTIPDGVIYLVEGAGGNRDNDDDLPPPRGTGLSVNQDESATGTTTLASGLTFPNGPASWLDTNLTNAIMSPFIPGAGSGPKITVKFKTQVFSFADVVVNDNTLTLYQISEPLSSTASGGFGTDIVGAPLNDPLPDTIFEPPNYTPVATAGAEGTPALLDKIAVTKPSVAGSVTATLAAPPAAVVGGALVMTLTVRNNAAFALNGAQIVLTLPAGIVYVGALGGTAMQHGQNVVLTLGRLAPGGTRYVQIQGKVQSPAGGSALTLQATLRSGTALPISSNTATTRLVTLPPPRR